MTSNWKIQVNITRGTIGSRDFGTETTKYGSIDPLQPLEDCMEAAQQWFRHYRFYGYSMTAHAIAPDGTKYHNIHNG